MSDVNANIGVHIDTSAALAELKALQRQLAQFHAQVSKSSAAAAAAQKNLQTNLLNTINATGKFRAQMGIVRTSTESFTDSLEKNKFSMREYFRYAGGATKTFGKLFKSEFDTIGKVAEERVKRMQTQYIKMGRDATGAMKAMAITPTTLDMKDYGTQAAISAQKQALFNQLVKQGSTNLLNFGKNTQWAGRQLMVGFTIPLMYFGTTASKVFMDLEAQALKFRRVYGDTFTTTEETNKALADINRLASEFTKYGVAVSQTMEIAASAAAMGKTGAELTAQVAEATRLAVLGGVEQQQALDTTISLTNAFGLSAEELAGKINFLNAVENQTVTAIEDLTIAIPKAGPVVQQLGGSVEDLAFFLTAMREGGINASEGANALKSGLASLINPTNKARGMLKDLGINIDAIVEGNAGNLKEIVIDFAQALDTLSPLERSRAIEQLFGKFQFARLSTLFQNVTKDGTQAARVLELSGKSVEELAILSERELKKVEDAVGINFKEAVEQLKLAIAPIGKTFLETVTPILKSLGGLLEKFNGLSDGTKKFVVVATTLVGLIGPTLLMTFGLLANGAANIIKLFLALRTGFLKLTGNSTTLAQQTQYLTTEQMEAATVAASLQQAHNRLTQQFTVEAEAVNLLRNAYVQATVAAAKFAAANPGMMAPGFKGIKGGGTQKFADGTVEVLGGQPGKDSVLSLLTPGEAVIPAGIAQDDRFKPIVEALVTGKIPGYNLGTASVGDEPGSIRFNGRTFRATTQKTAFDLINKINSDIELAKKPGGVGEEVARRVIANRMQSLQDRGELLTKSRVFKHIVGGVTTSGGSRANNPAIAPLRSAINKQYAQASDKELRTLQQRLKDAGLNDTQVKDFVKKTEAHILDPANKTIKWTSGQVLDDYFGLNNYLNRAGGQSISSALTAVAGDVNKYRGLGYSEKEIRQLIYDHEFAKSKKHPTSYKELQSLGRIADFEKRLLASPIMGQLDAATRSDFLKQRHQAIGVSALLSVREPQFYKGLSKRLIQLGQGTATRVLRGQEERLSRQERRGIAQRVASRLPFIVGRGETLRTEDARGRVTDTTVTGQTGRPKPPGMRAIGGGPSDRRVISGSNITSIFPRGFKGPRAVGIGAQGGFNETSMGIKSGGAPRTAQSQQRIVQQNIDSVENDTQQNKTLVDQKKTYGQKLTTGANVLSGIAIAGSFLPGKFGEVSQKLTPFVILLSTIAMLAPSLKSGFLKLGAFLMANPLVALGAVIIGMIASFKVLDERNKKQARAQSDYIDAISATTDKMKKVGGITDKVGASEIAARRREGQTAEKFTTGYNRAGQQFGTSFLESEVGKGLADTFAQNLQKGGTKAVRQIALELSAYVSDGVMTAEQANSVARAIGINLSDMAIAANIQGELRSLIGPNGEDLLTDPLKVRLEIAQESQQSVKDLLAEFNKLTPDTQTAASGAPAAAALGAAATQSLEIIQAQRDAQNEMYNKKIRDLQASLAITKDLAKQKEIQGQIAVLKEQQSADDKVLAQQREDAIRQEQKAFKAIQVRERGGALINRAEGAFFTAKQQQVRTRFKGTGQEAFVDSFLKAAKDTESKQLEVRFLGMVGAGDLTPLAATRLIEMFGKGKEEELKTIISSKFVMQNPDKFAQLTSIAGGLTGKGAKKIGIDIISQLTAAGGEDKFDDRLAALTLLQKMDGKEINVAAFLKDDVTGKLDKLVPMLNKVEGIKSPITKEVIQTLSQDPALKELGPNAFAALAADWEHYANLDSEVQKTAIQTFITAYETIGAKEKEQFAISQAGGATSGTVYDYWMNQSTGTIAAELTKKQFAAGKPKNKIPTKGGGAKGGDKGRDTTLDSLLNRLKFVRDAAINASGGVQELMKITSKGGISKFGGVLQQLAAGPKGGFNREFISFLESMDDQTRKTYMTVKNGQVILTKQGKALKEAFNEQVIGDFQSAQVLSIQDTLAQRAALLKLKSAGVDNATALEMVADASLAVAINSKDISSEELKNMADKANQAKKEIKDLNLELQNLGQSVQDRISNLNVTIDALSAARASGITSKELLEYIASNQALAEQIASKGINDPVVQDLLKNQPKVGDLEGTVSGLIDPLEKIQSDFDKARDKAEKFYQFLENQANAAYKKWLQDTKVTFEGVEYSIEAALQAAQDKIAEYQEQIDDANRDIELNFDRPMEALREQIDDIQRGIEMQFDRPIEGLQREINGLQRQIEMQFDRPIQALQDESGRLSNDLSLMDRAAAAINEKYDAQEQALNKISELNQDIIAQEKQRISLADAITQGDISAAAQAAQDMRAAAAASAAQRAGGALGQAREAEIAGLRTAGGLTRAQVEERQFQISQQIYALEQSRAAIQAQIQIKQDAIYNLEQARLPLLDQIRDKEDQIYNLQEQKEAALIRVRDLEDKIYKITEDTIEPIQRQLEKRERALKAELDAIEAQRTKWDETQDAIDAAKLKADGFDTTMKGIEDKTAAMLKNWKDIESKVVTLTIIENRVSGTGTGTGSTTTGSTVTGTRVIDGRTIASSTTSGNTRIGSPYGSMQAKMYGGKVKPVAMQYGGRVGSDYVPTLLTPGEFVVNKASAKAFGPLLGAINDAKYPSMIARKALSKELIYAPVTSQSFISPSYRSVSSPMINNMPVNNNIIPINNNSNSVYNYNIDIAVNGQNINPNSIAKSVINEIKYIDSQRIKGL